MRNRALQLVTTRQVLLLDADFVPCHVATTNLDVVRSGVALQKGQILVLAPFASTVDAIVDLDHPMFKGKGHIIRCVELGPDSCGGVSVSPYPLYLGAQMNYTRWCATAAEPIMTCNIATDTTHEGWCRRWTATAPYVIDEFAYSEPY